MPVDQKQLHAGNVAKEQRFPKILLLLLLIVILLVVLWSTLLLGKIRSRIKSMSRRSWNEGTVAIRSIRA
jgi:Tfp pilus assembly protein PilO